MTSIATTAAADEAATLMALAAAGDQTAFAAIVSRHHEDMRRVCVVVAGDQQLAEDGVAAAWSIAWRKLGTVRDPANLRPWLVSVAVNETRRLLRDHRRRVVLEVAIDAVGDPPAESGVDPALGVGAIDLRNALTRLSPEDRALVAMRYLAGFDAVELAAATGRSPSGVRGRLSRLLDRLEQELDHG